MFSLLGFCFATTLLAESLALPHYTWRHLDYRDGLPHASVSQAMVQDKLGRVWLACSRGLYCYDGNHVYSFPHRANDTLSISENNVQAIYIDDNEKIWVGTRNRGISIYNPHTERFKHLRPKEEGGLLPFSQVWTFCKDNQGLLWIGGVDGLTYHHPDSQSYKHYYFEQEGYTAGEIRNLNEIRTIQTNPINNDQLYLGTKGGLLIFDKKNETFQYIASPYRFLEEGGVDKLEHMIMSILVMDSANIWMTTWLGGLMHYQTETQIWNQYFPPNIDQNKYVGRHIIKKNNEEIWIASRTGFGVFHIPTKRFLKYDHDRTDNQTIGWHHAMYCMLFTKDSTLFVSGTYGIEIAKPRTPSQRPHFRCQPFISSFLVNGRPRQMDSSVSFLKTFPLEMHENNLTFQLTIPYFQGPEHTVFQYRLKGLDPTWKAVDEQRKIHLTGLSGGRYQLDFRGRINDGPWQQGVTSPHILINRLLWRHPLFYIVLAVLAFSGIFAFYALRIRSIRREQHLKTVFNKKLADMEMAALRAQMNPHFMFNSLNAIKTYILKEKTQEASAYLTKFSKLMRAVLQNSKNELVTLEDELKALRWYIELEALRFEDEFTYELELAPELNSEALYIPPLLIQPYAENAIRHGLREKTEANKKLLVKVVPIGETQVRIVVEDNGIGRKKAQERIKLSRRKRRSLGMEITQHRIDLIHEKLNIRADVQVDDLTHPDGSAAGTRVHITIPKITHNDATRKPTY